MLVFIFVDSGAREVWARESNSRLS